MLTVALSLLGGAEPCPELPLKAGSVWVYRARVSWTPAGSTAVRDTTIQWYTEVLSVQDSAGARVALVRDWPTALAWWEPSKPSEVTRILCVGNKVYHLDREAIRAPTPDDLILDFPLSVGKLFGRDARDRDDTFYAWYVESATLPDTATIRFGARRIDSSYTITFRTLPDHQIMVVAAGVGIVEYTYGHHGTVATAHARLIAFSHGH